MATITDWKCAITIVILLNLIVIITTEDTNSKTFNVTCDPGPYYNEKRCQNNYHNTH